ncbi:Two-pore potassium channel like [Thalictrum thalictroides]|uniref:Two-pore potassium channel like n=1 Tax=Thalictrum thalictroides TaxID=46969 RepID=A0A7J6UWR4_THATH|nr:Two-pore potassium channel like [Thalictrum thalictroides]
MEKEPLLPYISISSPRRSKSLHHHQLSSSPSPPPPLCTLPEDGEITLPILIQSPLTPSELKDRLIFGSTSPTPNDHSSTIDALGLDSHSSPQSEQPLLSPNLNNNNSSNDPLLPLWGKSKSNLHRSKTAPAMAVINDFEHPSIPKPQFGSSSIVRQAFFLLIIYLSLGVLIFCLNRHHFTSTETHPVVDALYFCIVTMCTIGYGDITPTSTSAKLFSIMFVLVGFGFIDILLSGMVSYVLDLQESLLLSAVKGGEMNKNLARNYVFDLKKGRMRIRMKVGLALGVVVLCIGIGVGVMHFVEKLNWIDSIYLSVMSVTTVGYGDRAFNSFSGRLFASIWLLVSTLAVARAFLYLAEARIDKRHRTMAKWVLRQDMTVSEFLAADIDNNGFVSKSEYVIYKLKEMGKISEKDILQICNQFDRLDTGNCGKITLADLMEHHQH